MSKDRTLGRFLKSMHLDAQLQEIPDCKPGREERFWIKGKEGQFGHPRLKELVKAYYNLVDYSSSASPHPNTPGSFSVEYNGLHFVTLSIHNRDSLLQGTIRPLHHS